MRLRVYIYSYYYLALYFLSRALTFSFIFYSYTHRVFSFTLNSLDQRQPFIKQQAQDRVCHHDPCSYLSSCPHRAQRAPSLPQQKCELQITTIIFRIRWRFSRRYLLTFCLAVKERSCLFACSPSPA